MVDDLLLLSRADNGQLILEQKPVELDTLLLDTFVAFEPLAKEHFGLGLCITKEIVEAHGGKIVVKDTIGGGTTFQVYISFNGKQMSISM